MVIVQAVLVAIWETGYNTVPICYHFGYGCSIMTKIIITIILVNIVITII